MYLISKKKFFFIPIRFLALQVIINYNYCLINAHSHDKHGVPMGIRTVGCDTGKDDLKVDWDENVADYTCITPKNRLSVNSSISSKRTCHFIESNYIPQHYCMRRIINYNETIPTFGDHRPLWPIYGEYQYLPTQRWLHSLEHGAIVMLYHPCASPMEVAKLRHIVTNCLRRHVISPNQHLTIQRPLALIAWGCKLEFNLVNQTECIDFIKELSFKAPESINAIQGQFEENILHVSEIVPNSDYLDNNLCPEENFNELSKNSLKIW